jgi:hypothetical protein
MDLLERFDALRSQGQGYLEVEMLDDESPLLTVGFRGDHAVVHLSTGPESMSLLTGDGSVRPGDTVQVRIMDDPSEFTGDVVISVDRARQVVLDFIRGRVPGDLGEWFEL